MIRLLIWLLLAFGGLTVWALITGLVFAGIWPALWWWPTGAFGALLLEAIAFALWVRRG